MRRPLGGFIGFVATLILTASPVFAQNARVSGTVKDQSGGVMPGVSVTAKSNATGSTRTELTDANGNYRLVALLPGSYTVTAEIQGFASQVLNNVVLAIDQTATLDFTLKPATVAETVTVTGASPIVDVTRSDVGTAMTTQQMQDLPVAARRWIDMAMLTPGSSQDAIRGQFYRGNVSIGAGVTNFFSTGNVVDGVNNTWVEQGETRQNFPMEALEEFKVSTSTYNAEYGLATGGVVNVVTKTGTNDLHFSGFGFYRDQAMTAAQYFQTSTPPYSREQEGGSVGGPIVKDKIHYFITYERTDENVYNSVSTPAWPQYTGTYQSKQYRWTYLGRGDAQLGHGQSLFVRFGQEYEYRPELTVGGTTIPSSSFDFSVPRTSAVAGHTWVINSRALNDFRFQYAYSKYEVSPPNSHGSWDAGYFGQDRVGLCTPVFNYPSVSVGGCGNSQMGPEHRYQVKDDFAYQLPDLMGRHQLKWGADFSYVPFQEDNLGSPLGSWTFPLDQPFDPNNPKTFPTQYTQSLPTYANLPSKYYGLYVQDTWQAGSRLTFNLGLRYDRQLGAYGDNLTSDQSLTAQLIGQSAVTYPLNIPFIDTSVRGNAKNFGPRLGFAWDPAGDGRMNVHGGWGIYYDNMRTLQLGGEITWPQSQSIIINNPCKANVNCLNDPFNGITRTAFLSTAPPNITVMANNLRSPYSHSFGTGVTRQLTNDIGVTADFTYVNRFGDTDSVNVNLAEPGPTGLRPYPQFGRVSDLEPAGNSTYRALLVKMDKRVSHRWSALVSYTLASARDQPFANDYGTIYGYSQEDGYSLADRRHVLRASGTILLPYDMQLSAILDLRSSTPFNPATNVDINKDGFAIDLPPGVGFHSGCRDMDLTSVNNYRATFGLPSVSSVACPGYQDVDLRFSKSFLFQRHRFELIGQLFNLTNHANFASPVSNPLSATFGQVNQILSYINAPSRQGEVAVRFQF
jgi:outer membrane receptor protein involved in Fe transport